MGIYRFKSQNKIFILEPSYSLGVEAGIQVNDFIAESVRGWTLVSFV